MCLLDSWALFFLIIVVILINTYCMEKTIEENNDNTEISRLLYLNPS